MGKDHTELNKSPLYMWWTLIILLYAIDITLATSFAGVPIFTGNVDSARYLLSALSQSMAAIFALFFSITLITLQTFGARYTTKVYSLFFDRWFFYFFFLFILDIILTFHILGKIGTELTPYLTMRINSVLMLSSTLILILIPFVYRTKEILKPETIIKTITEEASELIAKGAKENNSATQKEYFDKAIDKIEILRDVSLKAALNREISVFRFAIRKWYELSEISKTTYVNNYLTNTFPYIFNMVANIDEVMATQGLDELGNIVREECATNDSERAGAAVEKLYWISRSLLKYPGMISRMMTDLRSTAQRYGEKMPIVSIEANRIFSYVGVNSDEFKLQKEAGQEILNVFSPASKVDVIKSSIRAFAEITRNFEKPVPPLLKEDINEKLYHVLYSLTVPQWELENQDSRKAVLEEILPLLEVNERSHVEFLIRVGATIEDQGIKKNVVELINEFLVNKISHNIIQKKDWIDRAFKKAKENTTYPDAIDQFRKNFD